jgi:gluconolactonase
VRRDGNVYFTDPAFGDQNDHRELDFFGIFHIGPKGELEAVARLKTRPHGITLSPGGKILYVADSDARLIRAWDLDNKGAVSNPRVFISKIAGVPGGLKTDEKGQVWIAAKSVFMYSPQGELRKTIEFSEPPSNLTFGDVDLETLFVTARTNVFRVRLGIKGAFPY